MSEVDACYKVRPPFIVLEGMDFSGKSTQVDSVLTAISLHPAYKGEVARFIKAPHGPIRELLLDKENTYPDRTRAMLNLSSMAMLTHENPCQPGDIPLVADRWYTTTMLYQGFTDTATDDFKVLIDAIHRPDLVIVLDVDAETITNRHSERTESNHMDDYALSRIGLYSFMYSHLEQMLEKVLGKDHGITVVHVDGTGTVEETNLLVKLAVDNFLTEYFK